MRYSAPAKLTSDEARTLTSSWPVTSSEPVGAITRGAGEKHQFCSRTQNTVAGVLAQHSALPSHPGMRSHMLMLQSFRAQRRLGTSVGVPPRRWRRSRRGVEYARNLVCESSRRVRNGGDIILSPGAEMTTDKDWTGSGS